MVYIKSSMFVVLLLCLVADAAAVLAQSRTIDSGAPSGLEQVDKGVWVVGRPAPLFEIGLTNTFDRSGDGRWLAFGSDRELLLFDRARDVVDQRVSVPVPVWHVQFSPDSRRVAVVLFEPTVVISENETAEAELRVWDVDRGRFAMKQTIASDELTEFSRPAFSADGRLLAIGGRAQDAGGLVIYGVRSEEPLFRAAAESMVQSVAFDRSDEAILFVADDRLWRWRFLESETPEELLPELKLADVSGMVYHRERHLMVVTRRSGGAAVVDLATRRMDSSDAARDRTPAYHRVALSDDGRRFLVEQRLGTGSDGRFARKIRVGRTSDARWIATVDISGPGLRGLQFDRRNHEILYQTIGQYGISRIDLRGQRTTEEGDQPVRGFLTGPVAAVAWSPGGRSLFAGTIPGDLTEFDARDGRPLRNVTTNGVVDLAVNQAADRLAYRPYLLNESPQLYDLVKDRYVSSSAVPRGAELSDLLGALRSNLTGDVDDERPEPCVVRQIQFTPDGDQLLMLVRCGEGMWTATRAAAADGRLVWRKAIRRESGEDPLPKARRASLSRDGRMLAVVDADQCHVAQVETGESVSAWPIAGSVSRVIWSPGQTRLAGLAMRHWQVWSIAAAEPLMQENTAERILVNAAFRDDQRLLVVWKRDRDRILEEWDVEAGVLRWDRTLGVDLSSAIDVSQDGRMLAAGTTDGRIMVVDLDRLSELPR